MSVKICGLRDYLHPCKVGLKAVLPAIKLIAGTDWKQENFLSSRRLYSPEVGLDYILAIVSKSIGLLASA